MVVSLSVADQNRRRVPLNRGREESSTETFAPAAAINEKMQSGAGPCGIGQNSGVTELV